MLEVEDDRPIPLQQVDIVGIPPASRWAANGVGRPCASATARNISAAGPAMSPERLARSVSRGESATGMDIRV
jgi:hypothetical protein